MSGEKTPEEVTSKSVGTGDSSAKMRVAYYSHGKETHAYDEEWVKTAYHCPNCGKKSVWVESDEGDYYVGPPHLCIACGHGFSMPGGCGDESENDQSKQRLKVLRALPNKQMSNSDPEKTS